jgi:hypothetical protein
MGKTKRNASRWMETRFKLGDPRFPEDNAEFFDNRYQNKMRNRNRSYYALFIDPKSMKVRCWRDYGNWAKAIAHRAARHNAKLLIIKITGEILIEQMQDLEELWFDDDWYDEDMMGFDFSYSDEAYDYAEQRRQEELEDDYLDYGYDPYMDWDY